MGYISNVKEEPEQSKYYLGFSKGLNTIQDKTLIGDKYLTRADNAMLEVDGLTRRYGTTKPFDEGSASKVYGAGALYKITTGVRKFIRIANSRLQYLDGDAWTAVSAKAYTSKQTSFVQIADKVYIHNGTDALSYYDGSTITTYTDLASVASLTVTPTGSAGTTAYSYRVSAFNTTGETEACARTATATGNATLSTTNYNALAWTAVASASGYNIYGRKQTGYTEVYMATVYTNAYNDTGTDTPATNKLPTESDTTGGIKGKFGCFTMGRQFVAGVTEGTTYYPTRLYYSGTVLNVGAFSWSEVGGGWVPVSDNDGGEIVDIKPFDSGVVVFKTNGIYKFYFTSTGLPALQEITRAHGGCSFNGSQLIGNDLMFVGQKENHIHVFSLGFQANYTGDQVRTNKVSVFIDDSLEDVNRTYLSNICSRYYGDKFGFAYTLGSSTENDVGYVLDTQFGGWVKEDGLPVKVTQYFAYDDGSTSELYGCSNHDGYMIQLNQIERNDAGSAFTTQIGTKFYNMGMFDVDKIWRDPTFWFKYIESTALTITIYVDGVFYVGSVTLVGSGSGAGIGIDLAGSFLAGENYSEVPVTSTKSDLTKILSLLKMASNIGFYIRDTSANSNWLYMGHKLNYSPLIGKPATLSERVTVTS